ncbi:MAG: hypothetical protein R2756_09610 [Bacteroidales bacterium]
MKETMPPVSIHRHPSFAYPYFSGFEGEGKGGESWLQSQLPIAGKADT